MTSTVVQLRAYQTYSFHWEHLDSAINDINLALDVELRTCSPENRIVLISYKNKVNSTASHSNRSGLIELANILDQMRNNGFEDVVSNSKIMTKYNAEDASELSKMFECVVNQLPEDLQPYTSVADDLFEKHFDATDIAYSNAFEVSIFKEIHSIFTNIKISSMQRFTYLLGTFLSNAPKIELHNANYFNRLTPVVSLYLANISPSKSKVANLAFVADGLCLAFGYAIAQDLHSSLKQHANVNYLMLEDPQPSVDALHEIDSNLLTVENALITGRNKSTHGIINTFLTIDTKTLLELPNAYSMFHIIDFIIPTTQGPDFFPVNYMELQSLLVQEDKMEITRCAIIHTLISLLKIQIKSDSY